MPERIDRDQLRRYEAALRSYIRRRAHPADVDDLVQEALTRLLATRRDTDVATPLAYLFRIASNLLADHARLRSRASFEPCTPEIEQALAVAPDQELGAHLSDLQSAYEAALAELSPRCRHVFVMRRHGERDTAEIAHELGISHRMVQKYMVQALALLSARLAPFLAGD
jgi:RNA polymerase sigma factor (sigma-70 family)